MLHDHGIRPVQQFDPSKGKNASDIALAVDAVEILHTQRPDAFALVSSDADFTPLVMHLREHGAHVYGFGDAKTPEPFQSACTRFLVLNRLPAPSGQVDVGATETEPTDDGHEAPREPAVPSRRRATAKATSTTAGTTAGARPPRRRRPPRGRRPGDGPPAPTATPARATRAQLRGDAKLVRLLRGAVEGAADDSGWARVGTVGNHIANQSSFDPRNYGYAKLSKLLEATDLFEMRDPGAPNMAVRDRRGPGMTSGTGATSGNH